MLFQWALGEGHLVCPVTEEENVTTPGGGVRGGGMGVHGLGAIKKKMENGVV